MTSVQEKINLIIKKNGITRDDLKQIAGEVYKDRLIYGGRKVKGKRAIIALNLIYYNQWVIGPYLRELRFCELPWYKRLFERKYYGIQPSRKTGSISKAKGIGRQGPGVSRKINANEAN